MTSTISANDKKNFIKWFLNNHSLKRREVAWILKYVLNYESILEKIHFVNDISNCPKAIMASTHGNDDVPFRFYKKNVFTTDADKAFHDIRLNKEDDLYIQLNFKNKQSSHVYVGILEDNPFMPNNTPNDEMASLASDFFDYCLSVNQKQKLKQQIDEALDKNDKDEFERLTAIYNKIKVSNNNFTIIKR